MARGKIRRQKKEVNPIQEWIEDDEVLSSILVEIQDFNLSIPEQAEIAFHRLSELYSLPKTPIEADERQTYQKEEIVSVYQELGLIKFLEPDGDIRGLVLTAIYNVRNKITIDIDEVYKKARANFNVGICFKGENSYVTVHFLDEKDNWFNSGCLMYLKPSQ